MSSSAAKRGSGRRESVETAFWALMREVFPAQTRTHMHAAGREQLLAARSYLDHWIAKLDEKAAAAPPPEREEIDRRVTDQIGVIGAGAWGTTLAIKLAAAERPVTIWAHIAGGERGAGARPARTAATCPDRAVPAQHARRDR